MRALAPLILALGVLWPHGAPAHAVTGFTLANGLDVVVIEDHRTPAVVQMIWYRAGAADEPPGTSGIAHFLEHLMFKGTEKFPDGALTRNVEANGGNDNAFTSWDYTGYFQRIAADRLSLVMKMEADRMENLRLGEDDVRTERAVILEERSQRTDTKPGALLNEQMRAAQFLNHHYGIPVIGWRHEMEKLSRDDALAWYRAHYTPENAILVIAGDTTVAHATELAERHYGPLVPRGDDMPRIRPQEPPQIAPRRVDLVDERVSEPYLLRTYIAPARKPGDQRDAAALGLLASILGGDGQSSYLARALQFDSRTAVHTSAFYTGTALDYGVFGLFVMPVPGVSLADAERALDDTLATFLDRGVDKDALARAKMTWRSARLYGMDSVQAVAHDYGEGLAIGLTIGDIERFDDVVAAVSADDIMAAARDVLDRRHSVTGLLHAPGDTPG